MITIKSKSEIEKMRVAGRLTGEALKLVEQHIRPGISTLELDKIAYDFIKKHGATPSFLHYNGFPASICASPNSWVVHGIPSKDVILKEESLILNFVYKTGTAEKEVNREKLEDCLSNGEKKALYILNILYELKAKAAVS